MIKVFMAIIITSMPNWPSVKYQGYLYPDEETCIESTKIYVQQRIYENSKYFRGEMKKLLILFTILFATAAVANDTNTQTNTSGSNTNITGGYTTTNNNTYQSGSSNDTTSTTTNNTTNSTAASEIPPPSANSPSYSSMSQDVCSMGVSGSLSTLGVGISGGKHVRDLNCERIKLSKVLYDYGMKVAAVSLLCQDERVFEAMLMAGTPCPFEGKIGSEV